MSLTDAFRAQAVNCAALGSPFMERLMGLMANRLGPVHGPVAARLYAWQGDVSGSGHSLPLRLAGGLHALRLQDRAGLAAVYPPAHPGCEDLWQVVSRAMIDEADFLNRWVDSPPQTNELRRAAVIRATAQWLTARTGLPLEVLELGASAGLNLNFDRFGLTLGETRFGPADAVLNLTPDWSGPLPPTCEPYIIERRGVDLTPLHPTRDRLRLKAYIWPDQVDRLARMDAALTLPAQPVDAGDAADWLEARLADQTPAGTCLMIYHTVAWQYFPAETVARASTAIEAAGAQATQDSPLAVFGMESDGNRSGAAMTLRLWPGNLRLPAGRVDFHGRWVNWLLG